VQCSAALGARVAVGLVAGRTGEALREHVAARFVAGRAGEALGERVAAWLVAGRTGEALGERVAARLVAGRAERVRVGGRVLPKAVALGVRPGDDPRRSDIQDPELWQGPGRRSLPRARDQGGPPQRHC